MTQLSPSVSEARPKALIQALRSLIEVASRSASWGCGHDSDSEDLEDALAAQVAKAEATSQRGEMACRLGWVLYWICFALAGGWAAFGMWAIITSLASEDIGLRQWSMAVGPSLLLYGLGRAFLYILAEE
jgi:hypothetical protein